MPIYVMLATFTDEDERAFVECPDRIEAVVKRIEGIGARVLSNYGRMSSYDIVNVIEVPDSMPITRIEQAVHTPEVLCSARFMGPYPSARDGRIAE